MKISHFLARCVAKAEQARDHPILASLRFGVMWSLIPAGTAILPLYFLFSPERDWNLRVMDAYLASLGLMGPGCALLIGQFLSKFYKVRSFAGCAALAVYLSLLPFWPTSVKSIVELLRDTFTSGPFVGFFLAIFLGGIIVWLHKKWPRLGFGAEALGLLLGFFLILFFRLHGYDIHTAIRTLIAQHISKADNLSAGLFIVGSMNFLWFCGLQGSAMIGSFITAVYAQLVYENMQAAASGQVLPHLVTLPFLNYAFVGGAGATFLLPFFMAFAKSKKLRILGMASIPPCLFNVNESIIYLLPLVFNTYFVIPFLISPLFIVVTTFYAQQWEWIPKFVYYIPGLFYLPSPLLAIVGTTPGFTIPHSLQGFRKFLMEVIASGSWKTGIFSLIQIVLLGIFYYPFYKAYDRKVAEAERKAEALKLTAEQEGNACMQTMPQS